MKKTIITLIIMAIVIVSLFISCDSLAGKVESSVSNVDEKQHDLDYINKIYGEKYNKFEVESEDDIIINEQLISESKLYSNDKKEETKIAYEKKISVLEAKNEKMKEKLNDYKEFNVEIHEKHESFKKEFIDDMNELKESLYDLGKQGTK